MIVGEAELVAGSVQVKDLASGTQTAVATGFGGGGGAAALAKHLAGLPAFARVPVAVGSRWTSAL